MPLNKRAKYQRVALYPKTHKRIKNLAKKDGKNIIDWMEDNIPKVEKEKPQPPTETS
jgi:hypothetical protein